MCVYCKTVAFLEMTKVIMVYKNLAVLNHIFAENSGIHLFIVVLFDNLFAIRSIINNIPPNKM